MTMVLLALTSQLFMINVAEGGGSMSVHAPL